MNIKKNNVYIYPLESKVVFPYHEYTFSINSNLYEPDKFDNLIGFVTKLDDAKDTKNVQKIDNLSRYGALLKIHKSDITGYRVGEKTKIYHLNLIGLTFARFRISSLNKSQGRILANIEIFQDQMPKEVEQLLDKKQLLQNLKREMKVFYECKLKFNEAEIKKQIIEQEKSVNKLVYRCVEELDLSLIDKLRFLQMNRQDQKIEYLLVNLSQRTENVKSVIDLEEKVRQDMLKSAAKKKSAPVNFFNVQGRGSNEMSELQQKINAKNLPQHVKDEINKGLKRLGGETSSAVSLKYIETLLEIPWNDSTEEIKDIAVAEKILQDDHTGLKEVKERILEFLAVKFRNGNSKGNVICLHGPPGVGKTSISKSIAKALGKQFTRVSLGGMHDEAELRGHRRTYVAALPGVIIRALMKAKSNNPVILLDEIEKIGKSYKGDPEHALLQILDPSQNNSFVDHYVGIPVDLSKVMFICTANSLQLSNPLLNRLELIEIPGYTREEKLLIAENHLMPKQLKENGAQGLVTFEKPALEEVIKYSREMGVRELERNLAKICRKIVRKGEEEKITKDKVGEILGKRHKMELWKGVGVVNGLAWSPSGGKVLIVEAIQYMGSKAKIELTGQLGEVMKESVMIALSWIKAHQSDFLMWAGSNYETLKLTEKMDDIDKISVHIHFPEGATKKDGPSAGVTIVTCLMSVIIKVPVLENLAMTGEITLSGQVLPVGGIREKCIAAIYEDIKHIIIPYDNLQDLDKIDPEIKKKATFYPVKTIKEVLALAFPTILDKTPPKI